MKKFICSFYFLCLICSIEAQFYNSGSNPLHVKWNEIRSDKFQIIFPEESGYSAQRLAFALDLSMEHTAKGINSTVKKPVKIILHNQNINSNGFVVTAPRRMELMPTPPQKSYAQNWIDQLALHEYRHIAQIDKLNQGFTKFMYFLGGEASSSTVMGYLPLWFLEGDAVVNETALSKTGRGREPEFTQHLKSIELLYDKRLSYDQAYLGTYKTLSPSYYEMGYHMVAWSKTQYNPELWSNTLNHVARYPFTFIPFYYKLKKETGLSKVKLYNNTFDYLKNKWLSEINSFNVTNSTKIPVSFKSKFVHYKYPFEIEDGSVLALRTSIDDIDRLIKLQNGKETHIQSLGSFSGSQIAYSENYVAWEEKRNNVRWEQRSYSLIKILDLKTNKSCILSKKERHFSPSISPSQNKLAVQKIGIDNRSFIQVYDLLSRKRIAEFEHIRTELMTYNDWISDSVLVMVSVGDNGKSIYSLNIHTSQWNLLFGPVRNNISSIYSVDNEIYFTYTKDGRKNIYMLNISSGNIYRVTKTIIGADYPSKPSDSNYILYSEYSKTGYKLYKYEFASDKLTPLEEVGQYKYDFAERLSKNQSFNISDTNLTGKTYTINKYSRLKNSINIHSWTPGFYYDVTDITSDIFSMNNILLGINFLSQNMLNTVTSSFGYYYNKNRHHFNTSLYLTALYPVISFHINYGGSPDITPGNVNYLPGELKPYYDLSTRVSIPFNLSRSLFYSKLIPSVRFKYKNSYIVDSIFYSGGITYNTYEQLFFYRGELTGDFALRYYLLAKSSKKDIKPPWGISVYASSLIPFRNIRYFYSNTVLLSKIYVPGIFRHHSLSANFGLESGKGNRMPLPRGYSILVSYPYEKMWNYSFDYSFPIIYPDLSIGPLLYIKRVQAQCFYDYSSYEFLFNSGQTRNVHLESGGISLGAEMNFFRFFVPIIPKIQYTHKFIDNTYDLSFTISANYNF